MIGTLFNTIPDAKVGAIEDLAEWYAANLVAIQAFDGLMWHLKRRLGEAIRDQGPLATKAGKLALATDKWRWDESTLLEEFPAMGAHQVKAEKLTLDEAERVYEVLLETGVDAEKISHGITADLRLMNSAIKTIEPEKAARLLSLRQPAGKLELR